MKVTYEEAIKSLSIIASDDYMCLEDNLIVGVFIAQHKPPTWEEVVNAWEMCGYKTHKKTDDNLMFRLGGSELHSFVIYANGKIKISDAIHYLRSDELIAINLTIRYLESHKG